MIHDKRPGAAELVPEREGRADRAAGIPRSRLHVDPPERRHPPYFAVRNRIHGAAAGEREVVEPIALMQPADQIEEGLFVHVLDRARDVAMPVVERFVRGTARPQQLLQGWGKQIAKFG